MSPCACHLSWLLSALMYIIMLCRGSYTSICKHTHLKDHATQSPCSTRSRAQHHSCTGSATSCSRTQEGAKGG